MRTFDKSVLPLTTAVAAAVSLAGCGRSQAIAQRDVAVCRDAGGTRIADSRCRTRGSGAGAAGWHFYGKGERVPDVGERVAGGSATARPGATYARASSATVSRGGFGSSARSFGSARS